MDPADDRARHHDAFKRRVVEDYSCETDLTQLKARKVGGTCA